MMDSISLLLIIIVAVVAGYIFFRSYQDKKRTEEIMSHLPVWGQKVCEMVVKRQVGVDMTEDMVRLSWGEPSTVDQKEVTSKSRKYRWVYGQPRKKGANYVWFTDGRVTKIKT